MSEDRPSVDKIIAFIGFGEAGQALTAGWRSEAELSVRAYDIKTDDPATREGKLQDYARHAVMPAESATAAADGADIIVSAVTADAILDAAESVLPALAGGQLYLDINSAAPSRKRRAAERVAQAGGSYVDVAVMAPVHPGLHRTPLIIGGPGAKRAESLFKRLNMNFEVISDRVGDASTVKMVRSVMIKGIESLTVECLLAAVTAGIEERILGSLEKSFPGMDWKKRADYMLERVAKHGERRAAEMRAVAETLEDLGIGGTMAAATAERQQWVADLNPADRFPDGVPGDYRVVADAILALHSGKTTRS
ncbi:MAG: NAD(P)-dependent oxidoreductase [Rhodospirillales bacterium]|nr:MAG: NAD(P)-dependent oxidoreductase [Rhodospirillales bacterium]